VVRLAELERGLAVLRAAGIDSVLGDHSLRISLPPEDAARVTRTLAEQGLYLTELRPDAIDLETVFLELTSEPGGEAAQ
jgi:ABC-2 type transport system ATP-binding protein